MELTQEYFDQKLKTVATKDDLKQLATKDDIQAAVTELASMINETVAEPMEQHFAELKDHEQLRDDVQTLKREIQQIKTALHLS
jgi:uncharacterized protein YlxW (UPF0749 family)